MNGLLKAFDTQQKGSQISVLTITWLVLAPCLAMGARSSPRREWSELKEQAFSRPFFLSTRETQVAEQQGEAKTPNRPDGPVAGTTNRENQIEQAIQSSQAAPTRPPKRIPRRRRSR